MKYRVLLLVLALVALRVSSVYGNHVFGGDLRYAHISGNTYKLILTIYGDCQAKITSSTLFAQLDSAQPQIEVYNNGTRIPTLTRSLGIAKPPVEVSPVCPSEIKNTTCNGGSLPGVYQFIYEDTVTLPFSSAGWSFVFNSVLGISRTTGSTITYNAGRSSGITNIVSPGGTTIQLIATIDNTIGTNNSPVFSTIPTPFYCVNALQQFNHGAFDSERDSLRYELVPGIDNSIGSNVTYQSGYSAIDPLSTAPGMYTFSGVNGQMTFIPDIVQKSLVVTRVREYRGGKLVGTCMREMTFIVRNDCDVTPPTAYVADVVGAVLWKENIISICQGQPSLSFNIFVNNPSGDSVMLTATGAPAGSSLTIVNNGSPSPSVRFSWVTGSLLPGLYSFVLKIKSNHCPISTDQSQGYTIRVAPPISISATQLSATQCINKALVAFDITGGFPPRYISVRRGSSVVKVITDTTETDRPFRIFDSLASGNYTISISSDSPCTDVISFTVTDSGTLPLSVPSFDFCLGDSPQTLNVPLIATTATAQWYLAGGSELSGPPTVNPRIAGVYDYFIEQRYLGCTSGRVLVRATVHLPPDVSIVNAPETVCYGDKVYLKAQGALNYTWRPNNNVSSDTGGFFAQVYLPITFSVTGTDRYGCTDSASVAFENIEQCCQLSYPTAFTPNNDGRNDGWCVVTYGNMQRFELRIFNRFGQLLFLSDDPKRRWDGTFQGSPCEIGTYYFYLNAKCLTGPKEFYSGDITLIR